MITRRLPDLPASVGLERELDALLADVVDAGEAEHVRHHLARRVVAAVFAALEQARDAAARRPASATSGGIWRLR